MSLSDYKAAAVLKAGSIWYRFRINAGAKLQQMTEIITFYLSVRRVKGYIKMDTNLQEFMHVYIYKIIVPTVVSCHEDSFHPVGGFC